MNFAFIIDTSLSMSQYFDKGYNYFDAAKNAIEIFIRTRELIKNKSKPDKYFLVTTGVNEDVRNLEAENNLNNSVNTISSSSGGNFVPSNVLSSWVDPTDHLLFQLKTLKMDYSLTNIENAIQTSLNLLNSIKKIGPDKHIHGRLISKISNSFILLFTDGGKLNTTKKVFTRNNKVGLTVNKMNNLNNLNNPNPILFSDLYSEPFKWDTSIFSFLLNFNADDEGVQMLKKYSSIIGGNLELIENFDELISKTELYALKKLVLNRVNINLEINNNVINLVQLNEINSKTNLNTNPSMIKFVNKNNLTKSIANLSVDFKQFKLVPSTTAVPSSASADVLFDRNESITYKEKWPLPEDFVTNKNIKNLIKKKARPTYIIANEIKNEFACNISRSDYDEYEILTDESDFMIKFLENYPGLTLGLIKNNINSNTNISYLIYWELYNVFQETTASASSKPTRDPNPIITIPKKPFAIIKLVTDSKKLINNKNISNEELSISEFLKKDSGRSSNIFKLKLCVLPYNYTEFFNIITSFNNAVISESEFIIQIEKYMKKIPFYYKPYIVQYLEKKNLWKVEDSFYRILDEENLNENVITVIKNITNEDKERISELNMTYNFNKQLHLNKTAKCCGWHKFKLREIKDNVNSASDFESFLNLCSVLNKSLKITDVMSNLNIAKSKNDELPIEAMGDYRDNLFAKPPLRSPYLFDHEVKEFKGDYFGNPFKRYTIDEDLGEDSKEQIKSNMNNPNISINDGENLLINSSYKNQVHLHVDRILQDDELSVFPDEKEVQSAVNYNYIKNIIIESDFKEKEINDSNANANVTNTIISPNNILQQHLIDDDLTLEFQEMFTQKDSERHGTKINNKLEVDLTVLYDWKFKEKLKEYSRKILQILKSNQKKEIFSLLDDILNKPLLFYTELQKISFLKKIKSLSESYSGNKNVTCIMMNKYINEKINTIRKS